MFPVLLKQEPFPALVVSVKSTLLTNFVSVLGCHQIPSLKSQDVNNLPETNRKYNEKHEMNRNILLTYMPYQDSK
jgi:hypothetical protein